MPLIRNGEHWQDASGARLNAFCGGILRHDGWWWWYGTHYGDGPQGGLAEVGVVLYRSRDLGAWERVGTILGVESQRRHDLHRGCRFERPKILRHPDGRFVLWFHLVLAGCTHATALAGVAEAERIEGPWRYLGSFQPDGFMLRDMTLFAGDNGEAWLCYAAGRQSRWNDTLHMALLSRDWLSTSGTWAPLLPERSTEAPAVVRLRGRWWLLGSGCSGWKPNRLRSAVADHPLGPWYELGDPCAPNPEPGDAVGYRCQPANILALPGQEDGAVLMADRWCGEDHAEDRHIWLPFSIDEGRPRLRWQERWELDPGRLLPPVT